MRLLDEYNETRRRLFAYFGYPERYKSIPIEDATKYFWRIRDGFVGYVEKEEQLEDPFEYFLMAMIFRGKSFTMICENNSVLRIFDNSKERPLKEEKGK